MVRQGAENDELRQTYLVLKQFFLHQIGMPEFGVFRIPNRCKSRAHILGSVKTNGINSVSVVMIALLVVQLLIEKEPELWVPRIFPVDSGTAPANAATADPLVVVDLLFAFLQFIVAELEHTQPLGGDRLYLKYVATFKGLHGLAQRRKRGTVVRELHQLGEAVAELTRFQEKSATKAATGCVAPERERRRGMERSWCRGGDYHIPSRRQERFG